MVGLFRTAIHYVLESIGFIISDGYRLSTSKKEAIGYL